MVRLTEFEDAHPLLRLFPALKERDAQATETKMFVVLCAAAVTLAVFLLSYVFSVWFSVFRALKTREKVFWCLNIVRCAFGVVIVVCSGYYWFVDPALRQDVARGVTQTSLLTAAILVGFFLFEVVALAIYDTIFGTFDPALFAHHWLCFVGSAVTLLYYESAHYFGIQGVMVEMTTPFSCICWLLLKSKKVHTKLWKGNQLFLIHLFHMRTVIEGYFLLVTYWEWDNVAANMPLPAFVLLYTQLVLQFVWLTPNWTYKKTVQFFNPTDFNQPTSEREPATASSNKTSAQTSHAKSS